MAEVLGVVASGVTLAALFKTCVDAFELVQVARHQETDFHKLRLRLQIERCRLFTWGEAMGLVESDALDRPIDRSRFPEVIREILQVMLNLFEDSHKIRDKYGCQEFKCEDSAIWHPTGTNNLLAMSSKLANRRTVFRGSKVSQTITWMIQDRKKFGLLIEEINDLMNSLQGLTSPIAPVQEQTSVVRGNVTSIRHPETLSMIAEVCARDHPEIASAASDKAETLTFASEQHRDVAVWAQGVLADSTEAQETQLDVESLTLTELKHKILELERHRLRGVTGVDDNTPSKTDVNTMQVDRVNDLALFHDGPAKLSESPDIHLRLPHEYPSKGKIEEDISMKNGFMPPIPHPESLRGLQRRLDLLHENGLRRKMDLLDHTKKAVDHSALQDISMIPDLFDYFTLSSEDEDTQEHWSGPAVAEIDEPAQISEHSPRHGDGEMPGPIDHIVSPFDEGDARERLSSHATAANGRSSSLIRQDPLTLLLREVDEGQRVNVEKLRFLAKIIKYILFPLAVMTTVVLLGRLTLSVIMTGPVPLTVAALVVNRLLGRRFRSLGFIEELIYDILYELLSDIPADIRTAYFQATRGAKTAWKGASEISSATWRRLLLIRSSSSTSRSQLQPSSPIAPPNHASKAMSSPAGASSGFLLMKYDSNLNGTLEIAQTQDQYSKWSVSPQFGGNTSGRPQS